MKLSRVYGLDLLPFAENIPVLKRNGIVSILTLDIMPLDCNIFKEFHLKFLYLRDEPSQDLLEILEDALSFIDECIQNKSNILVHCAMGVSRSASVVIAYLMRQNHLSYEEAYNIVSRKRSVFPNNGFINQLKLFHAMNWTVDRDSPLFRQYIAKKNFSVFTDYNGDIVNSQTAYQLYTTPSSFRCKKCRYVLFNSNQLRIHQQPETPLNLVLNSEKGKNIDNVSGVLIRGVSLNSSPLQCDRNELFCDPLEWTQHNTSDVEGKLYCPGCSAKVGSFNWCGEPCVCGTWVVPAFHFNRNHIDRVPIRSSNVTIVTPKPVDDVSSSVTNIVNMN
ncbi:Tyrosine-protein phosphatase YVH1 [Schistosoma japonicum]|nr:Tyrosine-protein phosphatase YVH1 [Schistosoma japonicum]